MGNCLDIFSRKKHIYHLNDQYNTNQLRDSLLKSEYLGQINNGDYNHSHSYSNSNTDHDSSCNREVYVHPTIPNKHLNDLTTSVVSVNSDSITMENSLTVYNSLETHESAILTTKSQYNDNDVDKSRFIVKSNIVPKNIRVQIETLQNEVHKLETQLRSTRYLEPMPQGLYNDNDSDDNGDGYSTNKNSDSNELILKNDSPDTFDSISEDLELDRSSTHYLEPMPTRLYTNDDELSNIDRSLLIDAIENGYEQDTNYTRINDLTNLNIPVPPPLPKLQNE